MTARRTILIAVLALAAAFVPASGASAANLTEERATVLASKLGREVAKKRNARYWRIARLVTKRTNRFVFEYGERLSGDRFCRANIVVTQSGSRRRAGLTGSRCAALPAEVLELERAVSGAIRSIEPKIAEVRSGNRAHSRQLEACAALRIPKAYRDDVDRLLELGVEATLYEAVLPELDAFAKRIASVGVRDSGLAAGVESWRKFLDLLEAIPAVAEDPCPALEAWANEGYPAGSQPVDFERLEVLYDAYIRHSRRILRSAERLFHLGVSERTETAFSPYGLMITAAGGVPD